MAHATFVASGDSRGYRNSDPPAISISVWPLPSLFIENSSVPAPSMRVKKMLSPSADHRGVSSVDEGDCVRLISAPPGNDAFQISRSPLRFDVNSRLVPSGDHCGGSYPPVSTLPVSSVRFDTLSPFASMT